MSAEALFFSEISKLKRRIVIRTFLRILQNASLIFLCICIFVFIIQKAGFLNLSDSVSWYILSLGFSLTAALLLALLKRRQVITILIEIDNRLGFQDRISTAYDYYKLGKKTVFSDLLMQDAATRLHKLSTKEILPSTFSWLHLLLILLIISNLVLFLGDYLSPDFSPAHSDQNKLEAVSELLRNYSISRHGNKKEKKGRRQSVYSQKIEHLSRKLKDRSLTHDQLSTTLHRFLREIQGEQTRQATELGAKLNAAEIDKMPIQTMYELENLSLSKLEKLKKLLNRTLNNQIPDSINQKIETLQELYSMEKLLSQILDDFNQGHSSSEEFTESKGDKTRRSQYTNDFKMPHNTAKRSKTNSEFSSRKRDRGDTTDQAVFDQLQENGSELQDELRRPEGHSSSAGRAKSTGEKKASDELEKSLNPGIQDKMTSSPVEHYLIHIRSLTAFGESRSKEEDIVRSYRQEIEGILQKEDIPLNYREYIKHYFISIGLEAEKNANGLK